MRSPTTRLNCAGLKQPAARMAAIHKDKHARRTIAAVAIALCAGVSQLAVAQDPKGLNIDVGNCVALEKPEERLACFEAQVEAARQRAASATASEATGAGAGAIAGATAGVGAGASAAANGAAERGPSSSTPAAPVGPGTAPAQSQKGASETSAENFGLPEPRPEPRPERSPERKPIEIVATVTELRQTVPNAYVITLDNGQVWRQAHPMPYPLRTGLVVRLRETALGYRLSAPELHGQINVERVR